LRAHALRVVEPGQHSPADEEGGHRLGFLAECARLLDIALEIGAILGQLEGLDVEPGFAVAQGLDEAECRAAVRTVARPEELKRDTRLALSAGHGLGRRIELGTWLRRGEQSDRPERQQQDEQRQTFDPHRQ
jgi:hypothetical protein